MYSSVYEEPESEISLKEVFWDLLAQWKAILIVALIMAAIVPAAKYFLDRRDYKKASAEYEAMSAQLPTEEQSSEMSIEELRNVTMADLSEADRAVLEHLERLEAAELVQSTYIDNAPLMKIDPLNQNTLTIRYNLRREGDYNLQALVDAYTIYLSRAEVADRLREVLSPDTDTKYIYELYSMAAGSMPDSDARSTVYTVNVTLPVGTDADAVLSVIDDVVSGASNELYGSIGAHSISRFFYEVQTRYNKSTSDTKQKLSSDLAALRDNIKKIEDSLTDAQKVARSGTKAIAAIEEKREAEENEAKAADNSSAAAEAALEKPVPPKVNPTFAAVGFALGVFLYAIIYLFVVVTRGIITSSDGLEDFVQCRMLGDVISLGKHAGLASLFHSRAVEERRLQGLGDTSEQLARLSTTIESVCAHAEVRSITAVFLSNAKENTKARVKAIADTVRDSGIEIAAVEYATDIDEKKLLDLTDVVFVVDDGCTYREVWKRTQLCRSYDVKPLGCMYIREF